MDTSGDRIEKLYKNYEILTDAKDKIGEVSFAVLMASKMSCAAHHPAALSRGGPGRNY